MKKDTTLELIKRWGAAFLAGAVLTVSLPLYTVTAKPSENSEESFAEEDAEETKKTKNEKKTEKKTDENDESEDSENKKDSEKKPEESENKKDSEKKSEESEKTYEKPSLGTGETGILIDMKTGKTLFSHDADKKMYPASTTKIMTALVALEAVEKGEIALEGEVFVPRDAIDDLDPESSLMNLKPGEKLSLHNVLKGLLIQSGNDAAMAVAYAVCGNTEDFVGRMNQKAEELGLTGTHFMNPHGLHDENHYTTAADLSKTARAAMQYETFREIVEIAHIKIPPTNMSPQRYYINTNGLLSKMRYTEYYYKNSTGIKTGHTSEAGNCLVSSAKRGGMELIGVIMGGKEVKDSHNDSIKMLDYGFNNFVYLNPFSKGDILGEVKVKQGKGVRHAVLSAKSEGTVLVPKGVKSEQLEISTEIPPAAYAPLAEGQKVGEAAVKYNGEELGRFDLVTDAAVERHPLGFIMSAGEFIWGIKAVRVIVYLLGAGILIFALYMALSIRREIKRMSSKRRRRSGYRPPKGSRRRG